MMYASSCSVHFFFMVSLGGALSFLCKQVLSEDSTQLMKASLGALRPPRWGESGARGDGAF